MARRIACFPLLMVIWTVAPTAPHLRAQGNSAIMRDPFDRWERVWHEGQYDLIAQCVQPRYIRHDEVGDRTVPRRGRRDRTYGSLCTITHSRATAHGSASRSSGPIRKQARHAAGREYLSHRRRQARGDLADASATRFGMERCRGTRALDEPAAGQVALTLCGHFRVTGCITSIEWDQRPLFRRLH